MKFEDAKPSALAEIHAGDQLRARGSRTPNGAELTATRLSPGGFATWRSDQGDGCGDGDDQRRRCIEQEISAVENYIRIAASQDASRTGTASRQSLEGKCGRCLGHDGQARVRIHLPVKMEAARALGLRWLLGRSRRRRRTRAFGAAPDFQQMLRECLR